MGMDRQILGVVRSDEEGQIDVGVKDIDRFIGGGMDREMLGRGYGERVLGSWVQLGGWFQFLSG